MIRITFIILIQLFFFLGNAFSQFMTDASKVEEGVSLSLAELRKSTITNISYDLEFEIPENLDSPIKSSLDLAFTLLNKESVILDFKADEKNIKGLVVNGKQSSYSFVNEHIVIDTTYLDEGLNFVSISFLAGREGLNFGKDYLFALFVPAKARTVFPCFDQPDLKANYKLTLKAPNNWTAVSGAPVSKIHEEGEQQRIEFYSTERISTYQFSFAAGRFNSVREEKDAFPMNFMFRENDSTKLSYSMDSIFELHLESVRFLENYTQRLFPFEKLDFIGIPFHPYGGMEHVGSIQYRESTLFLDSTATVRQKLDRAKLIAHETAHMWFGNLVTMSWFDDVWLKEVFANFIADKMINPQFPTINHDLNFLMSNYPSAYWIDRTKGRHAISQDLDNLKNAGSLYGSIIYNKAPIMMRQLENVMGAENFRQGLENYLRVFAHGNAKWSDLVSILNAQSEKDIVQWSDVWVNEPGRPVFDFNLEIGSNGLLERLIIDQKSEFGEQLVWPQSFSIGLLYKDTVITHQVTIENTLTILEGWEGLKEPEAVMFNYDGSGYGVFPLDQKLISAIIEISDDVARASCYINLYERTLDGAVGMEESLDAFSRGLRKEKNPIIYGYIRRRVQILYWNYLSAEERIKVGPELEKLAFNLILEDRPSDIKKNLYHLIFSIGHSPYGVGKLYEIWKGELKIDNLLLNGQDKTELARQLALFNHRDARKILKEAFDEISNEDRRRKFEFILPSLSNSIEVRDSVMQSFRLAENREDESLVLHSLGYIHHPLKQDHSITTLSTCLELIKEINSTGDIFFPKNWLDATVAQYSSSNAYEILNMFLNENPQLSADLRNKILQSADNLIRNQAVLRKE